MWRDEEISERREDGYELLQAAGGPKSLHHPFSFSKWHVRILSAIVQAFVRSMLDTGYDISLCGAI